MDKNRALVVRDTEPHFCTFIMHLSYSTKGLTFSHSRLLEQMLNLLLKQLFRSNWINDKLNGQAPTSSLFRTNIVANPMQEQQFITVGWREWVKLPELGIPWIKAKIDTGARTSCLHAFSLETFENNNELWIRFGIHPKQHNTDTEVYCEAKIIDQRLVTDSGGHREERYVIATSLALGNQQWPIEITLTNRDNMRFRMLLGRTAMEGKIAVNPEESFLLGKPPKTER